MKKALQQPSKEAGDITVAGRKTNLEKMREYVKNASICL